MSTLTMPFTFTPGTNAVASQVDANFTTLYGWVNGGSAIWADASRAFTVTPSGPNADPTSANQFARKSYVDGHLNTSQVRIGFGSGTTVAGGGLRINFSSGFSTSCDGVVLTANTASIAYVDSTTATNFHCINYSINGGTLLVGVPVGYYYVAWGH
jgi:hypothetical protein